MVPGTWEMFTRGVSYWKSVKCKGGAAGKVGTNRKGHRVLDKGGSFFTL